MDDALLPDDDLDLALARAVERGGVASDPLLARLAPLRAGTAVSDARTAALWARIEAQTLAAPAHGRTDRAPVAPAPRRRMRWATTGAFASLVLLAAVAVLTLRPSQSLVDVRVASGQAPETLRLADGSTIILRANSTLTQTLGDPDHVRFDLRGEASFDVTHNPQRRFEVATQGGTVAVLGTRFAVASVADSTTVTLERGRVELTSAAGASLVLAPGERATASKRGLSGVQPADAEAALDWTEGRLAFRRTPADAVAAELARHYGLSVTLPDEVERETVSGSLALGDADATMAALGRVLGGRFEQDADGTYRFVR